MQANSWRFRLPYGCGGTTRGASPDRAHPGLHSEPLDGGMYAKEYKGWIARKNETPPITETIDSFKEYWADVIALVNQTAIPATQHGYGMAAMDNDTSIASYGKSLANFGAAYAATQEWMKSQATTMAAMQGQLANIQQFCMAVNQQPPPTIYAPPQQQQLNKRRDRRNGGYGSGNGGGSFPQQPTWLAATVPVRNNPHALPRPTSVGRIGTTAILMVETLMTPTRA